MEKVHLPHAVFHYHHGVLALVAQAAMARSEACCDAREQGTAIIWLSMMGAALSCYSRLLAVLCGFLDVFSSTIRITLLVCV